MDTILNLLSGKKTYLTGGLGLIVLGLFLFGVIDQPVAEKALVALGLAGMITLRTAIAKSDAQAVETAQKVAALARGGLTYLG